MCEAWNEAGEATQTVRVTIKGWQAEEYREETEDGSIIRLEKRGKAKRTRKPPAKTAPKKDEEPSKKDQRKQAMEQQKAPETGIVSPRALS